MGDSLLLLKVFFLSVPSESVLNNGKKKNNSNCIQILTPEFPQHVFVYLMDG